MTDNPEVGVPVDPANDWHLPELIGRMWRAAEIQDALAACGFEPTDTDPNVLDDDGQPTRLQRNTRWVRGDQALRVPNDPNRVVSPYLAACVAALLA